MVDFPDGCSGTEEIKKTKIRIGSLVYTVTCHQDLCFTKNNRGLDGRVSHYDRVIRLRDCNSEAMAQALWHEACHALCMQANVNISESAIEQITHGLMQMVRDYPYIANRVFDDEEK
jgi:hypothetical protein